MTQNIKLGSIIMTLRYPALIDGEKGAYGVVFPDLDGVVAMGDTIDDAILNAEEALRDYALDTERDGSRLAVPSALEDVAAPSGSTLTSIPLIRLGGKPVRANMMLDADVLAFIDAEATRRKMTRTNFVSWMTRRVAQMGG
ncbi:type II toxin-antitoxin system HicB family antitoxin [Neorhizobium sp. T786]|uniref:type II toxin-antitoxin system HicB family antitoxin n=1 Tax=Pseudorhizobium xiangyangii TaxID=2883104 RepID=UPI001CFF95B6|nr:type II toxin-antitoxin system HicB family antitoxin [Neorhizobium xiangyangii]MCB5205149.1 type II toxin-antitoxin system HicB family antitoxin [Neorhizobium xiangyangii]